MIFIKEMVLAVNGYNAAEQTVSRPYVCAHKIVLAHVDEIEDFAELRGESATWRRVFGPGYHLARLRRIGMAVYFIAYLSLPVCPHQRIKSCPSTTHIRAADPNGVPHTLLVSHRRRNRVGLELCHAVLTNYRQGVVFGRRRP